MAVVKLDLVNVSGAENDFADTIFRCIAEPEFHMDDAGELPASGNGHGRSVSEQSGSSQIAELLTGLRKLAKDLGTDFIKLPDDSANPAASDELIGSVSKKLDALEESFGKLDSERNSLTEILREDEQIKSQLTHLQSANVDLDKVFACEFFRFRFGYMPRESYDNLSTYTADIEDMFFYASSVEKREVWGLYVTPHTKAARIDALFESLHFERVRISERAHGTPGKAIDELDIDIGKSKARLAEISGSLGKLSDELRTLSPEYATLEKLDLAEKLRKKAIFTRDGFTLSGYIPKSRAENFKAELEKSPSVKCTLEKAKTSNGVMPPTKLKNPGFLGGFEDFVRMYGLPSYDEIDPTPIVALTYFLFFGMMFGDVGQGAVIILVGALMWFIKKMSLGKVLMCVGVSSIGFGFFYGSVFGMEDLIHGFNPNENINTVLFAAVGIGVVMIIAVMAVNIINGIRQKNPEKIFFSQNGLPGLLLYVGAVVLVLGMLGYVKFAMPTGVLVGLIVVMLLVIFLREPLTKLVEGRGDVVPESKLDFILENFFELFEVVLSYLTNTISFIRIGAFALSHVGMMSVVFLLAETSDGYNPVILIIGNLFVIGFEGMIVCIQVLRLEFYELFGRFFEGNGRPFEPVGSKKSGE